jgi:hypothetical protein
VGKATAGLEWLTGWVDVGLWLTAVAKRGHGWIVDIDDLLACQLRGFDLTWFKDCFKVDTPLGGKEDKNGRMP